MRQKTDMKSDLNQGSSLFRQAKALPIQNQVQVPPEEGRVDFESLIMRVTKAIEDKDEAALPWLQLEMQMQSLMFLRMIDWKIWEFYTKFVK